MGMTIAEKIIAAAAGVDSVKPGDIYTVQLDHLMSTMYRLTARKQQHPRKK